MPIVGLVRKQTYSRDERFIQRHSKIENEVVNSEGSGTYRWREERNTVPVLKPNVQLLMEWVHVDEDGLHTRRREWCKR